jgi:hypothetical protein
MASEFFFRAFVTIPVAPVMINQVWSYISGSTFVAPVYVSSCCLFSFLINFAWHYCPHIWQYPHVFSFYRCYYYTHRLI